jgi:hypothetical protein
MEEQVSLLGDPILFADIVSSLIGYSYVSNQPEWSLRHKSGETPVYSYATKEELSPQSSSGETPVYSYATRGELSPHHSSTSYYTKGAPVELKEHNWFYGNITEEQADVELDGSNGFLVRHSSNTFILSTRMRGWKEDYVIDHSPEGYWLKEIGQIFKSIPEMIAHYQSFPIEEQQVLGMACDRTVSGIRDDTKHRELLY